LNGVSFEMDVIVERIRASKLEQMYSLIKAGFAAGCDWVATEAKYLALRALDHAKLPECHDNFTSAEFRTVMRRQGHESAGAFYTELFATKSENNIQPHKYFQYGFWKGAKAAWRRVKDKI
jgi:hypothetical protein